MALMLDLHLPHMSRRAQLLNRQIIDGNRTAAEGLPDLPMGPDDLTAPSLFETVATDPAPDLHLIGTSTCSTRLVVNGLLACAVDSAFMAGAGLWGVKDAVTQPFSTQYNAAGALMDGDICRYAPHLRPGQHGWWMERTWVPGFQELPSMLQPLGPDRRATSVTGAPSALSDGAEPLAQLQRVVDVFAESAGPVNACARKVGGGVGGVVAGGAHQLASLRVRLLDVLHRLKPVDSNPSPSHLGSRRTEMTDKPSFPSRKSSQTPDRARNRIGSSGAGSRGFALVPAGFEAVLVVAEDDQWQDRALCCQTDPEAFFPEKGGSTREAKQICLGCEVRTECLEYALAHDERFGIWGGLSERERRRLKRGII